MIIPKSCISWIKLQRHGAGYIDCKKDYAIDIEKEYKLMLPFLPESADSILDIGCGIGGIDILLSQHYANPEVYLLDADFRSSDLVYGFTDNIKSFYNSFSATKDMMEKNNVKNYNILNTKNGFPDLKNIDIIISILSYGYHYPVETYLEKINNSLSEDGILILDIREKTDGIKKIVKTFPYIDIISNFNKSVRICARRL